MAAGLSLPLAKLNAFEDAFVAIASQHMAKLDGNHALLSDGDLTDSELCLTFAHQLRQAGPFGQGFESPLFDGEFTLLDQRLVGQKHLKMVLKSDGNNEIDAIAFNVDLNVWPDAMVKRVHIAYRLDINVFRGQETVQLIIEQITAC
jgi:single-stranded-DNA-specific exonuclease